MSMLVAQCACKPPRFCSMLALGNTKWSGCDPGSNRSIAFQLTSCASSSVIFEAISDTVEANGYADFSLDN